MTKVNMLRCLLGLEEDDRLSGIADEVLAVASTAYRPEVFLFQRGTRTPYGRWLGAIQRLYGRLAGLVELRRRQEPRPDALSILCHSTDQNGDSLSTPEIIGELNGLFGGGFETTAMTMTWAVLMLTSSGLVTEPGEAWVDALVRESQRLVPVVPMLLPRRVTREVSIDGSKPVPRGALVYASALLEQRDPGVYPDPLEFRPARWLDGGAGPKAYQFLPYGVGKRRCLGAGFADLQLRTTLGLLVERGVPTLLTRHVDYRTMLSIVAVPKGPVMVRYGAEAGGPVALTGGAAGLWHTRA